MNTALGVEVCPVLDRFRIRCGGDPRNVTFEEREAMWQHVDACPVCQRMVAVWEAMDHLRDPQVVDADTRDAQQLVAEDAALRSRPRG